MIPQNVVFGRPGIFTDRSRSGWWRLAFPALSLLIAGRTEADLSQTGRWQGPYPLGAPGSTTGYVGSHVAALKGPADSSRIVVFGQSGAALKIGVWSFVANTGLTIPKTVVGNPPANVNFHGVVRPAQDLFCAGHASVKGRMVVVGGQYRPEVGTETPYEFNPLYTSPTHEDPGTGTPVWRLLASTARGRWYPSVTALSTGQLLASSGTKFGYLFTFGGEAGALTNDLRPLAMGNIVDWTSPTATGPPSARKDHTAIMDNNHPFFTYKRMVVFGGQTGPDAIPPASTLKSNQVWAQYLNVDDSTSRWNQFTITQDPDDGLPAPRSRHIAIYYVPTSGNPILIIYGGRRHPADDGVAPIRHGTFRRANPPHGRPRAPAVRLHGANPWGSPSDVMPRSASFPPVTREALPLGWLHVPDPRAEHLAPRTRTRHLAVLSGASAPDGGCPAPVEDGTSCPP